MRKIAPIFLAFSEYMIFINILIRIDLVYSIALETFFHCSAIFFFFFFLAGSSPDFISKGLYIRPFYRPTHTKKCSRDVGIIPERACISQTIIITALSISASWVLGSLRLFLAYNKVGLIEGNKLVWPHFWSMNQNKLQKFVQKFDLTKSFVDWACAVRRHVFRK